MWFGSKEILPKATRQTSKAMAIPIRYLVAALGFVGFVFLYLLRVNINVAIISMVDFQALSQTSGSSSVGEECGGTPSNETQGTQKPDAIYQWDTVVRSQVVGSFYYGYIFTQVPGGRLAEKIGAKKILAASIAGTALLNLLLPLSCKAAAVDEVPWLVILVRSLMGFCEGVAFPCMSAMLSKWAPVQEKARLSSIIFSGAQIGTVIGFSLSGFLADQLGWKWVFYVQGGAGFVWVCLWLLLVSDIPEGHPWISQAEVALIGSNQVQPAKTQVDPVPWKAIFTSMPFWAIFVANFGNNWGFHLLLTELPEYMKAILHKDIQSSALFSSLPYLCMWFFSIICGQVADLCLRKGLLCKTKIRKICTLLAQAIPALCILGICFTGCDEGATIVLLTVAVTFQGAIYSGFLVNPQDIAPNFAGTILGLTNGFATIQGWLAPLTAGTFTKEGQTIGNWRKVWLVTIVILVANGIFYAIFGSGEIQSWNHVNPKKEDAKKRDFEIRI